MKISKQILIPAETHHMFKCAAGHGYSFDPMPCNGGYGLPQKRKPADCGGWCYIGGVWKHWLPCDLIRDIPVTWTVSEHWKTVYQCSACKKWIANIYPRVPLHFGLYEYCKSSGALCRDCHHLWLDVNFFMNAWHKLKNGG